MNRELHLSGEAARWQSAYQASEARFRAIVDKSADGVVVVGTEGTILYVNPAAEMVLGRPAEQLCGEVFGIPIVPGDVTEIDVVRQGASRVAEMRIVETEWLGRPAFLATLRDVTDRKRREEQARIAVRRRDQFLAMLSHELRNPLAAIVNAARLLRRNDLAEETAASAQQVIDRESALMTRLLDDLLDVTRISRGKIDLRKETVDLAEIIENAAQAIQPLMDEHGVPLTIAPVRQPLFVHGDPARLQQIVVNLLSNAAKYSPCGAAVRVIAQQHGPWVQLDVEDQGIGIAPDQLEIIFEPFMQGPANLARTGAGLGIGLSLVRLLVELHGGDVRARSAGVGKGAVFTVRLPAQAAPQRPAAADAAASLSVPRLRVLLIEDNHGARETLKAILELEGQEVFTADDGPLGIALIEEHKPDVALVDIGLPGCDGYEVAARVRAHPACRGVFLVALTGYGLPEDRARALRAGFDAHLVKPLDVDAFLKLIAERAAASSRNADAAAPA